MSIPRRLLTGALVLTSTLAIGACGTSFDAATNQQYQAAEGANARSEVNSMNTVVVADESGSGVLSAGLVNETETEQTLTGITVTTSAGEELEIEPPAEDVVIPALGLVTLGSSEETAFTVPLGAEAGTYVTVVLTFSDAVDTEVQTPVVDRSETYESVVEAG